VPARESVALALPAGRGNVARRHHGVTVTIYRPRRRSTEVNQRSGARRMVDIPRPLDGKWRIFYTQQHGDNTNFEIIANPNMAETVPGHAED
jgi:hypothetical protein